MIIASAVIRAVLTAFAWMTAVSAGTVDLTPCLQPSPSTSAASRSTARAETGDVDGGVKVVTAAHRQRQTESGAATVADQRPSGRTGKCVAARLAAAGWLVSPMPNSYRDPILAQETNKKVDYQSNHSLGRGAENAASASDEDKYYDDTETTAAARAWKLKVGRAKANVPDDDDEETRRIINVSRTN